MDTRQSSESVKNEEEKSNPIKYVDAKLFADIALPDGLHPVFLSQSTQTIFNLPGPDPIDGGLRYAIIRKDDILQDFHNRAAVSDFSVFKDKITKYPGDSFLVIQDDEFRYGQNFVILFDESLFGSILVPYEAPKDENEQDLFEFDSNEDIWEDNSPRPWVNLGSDRVILEAAWSYSRPPNVAKFMRKTKVDSSTRRLSAVAAATVGFTFSTMKQDDASVYNKFITKILTDTGASCINEKKDVGINTDWLFPTNRIIQYEPLKMSKAETEARVESLDLPTILPLIDEGIRDNNFYDFYRNDYKDLIPVDYLFGMSTENKLREHLSFSELRYSHDKAVSCIRIHPKIPSILAMSVAERTSFSERMDHLSKTILNPSFIIIWSLHDPIKPQLLLESREDIMSFDFRPSRPNIVAAALFNGQIGLWDIAKYESDLEHVAQRLTFTKEEEDLFVFRETKKVLVPIVPVCCLTNIEASHEFPALDLQWLPGFFELARSGTAMESKNRANNQFVTVGLDGKVLFWDIRPERCPLAVEKNRDPTQLPMGVPRTFVTLNEKMKPFLKLTPMRPDSSLPISVTKLSLFQSNQSRDVPQQSPREPGEKDRAKDGGARKKTLPDLNTMIYLGSEDGELVYMDWMPSKDQETGKIGSAKPAFISETQIGPVLHLSRCPFLPELVLCLTFYSWHIWKEKVHSAPLLSSPLSRKRLTAAQWSSTKPALFYVTRADGVLEIWQLLEKTHEPIATQQLSTAGLTCLNNWICDKEEYLAVGDALGAVNTYMVPAVLCAMQSDSEPSSFDQYIKKEESRQEYVTKRFHKREQQRIEHDAEAKRTAIIGSVVPTKEELQAKMQQEYEAFLAEELKFKRELGLVTENNNEL